MTDPRSQAMQALHTANRRRWIIAILIGGSLLAMGSVLGNGFSGFDDEHTIWQNYSFDPPHWTGEDGILSFWKRSELGLYIPVTYMVWGALAQATYVETPDDMGVHLDARAFHAVSLLLHIGSVLLVYRIVRKVLSWRSETSAATRDWAAAAGALLFAVHPLQVESVAWTSGMKDMLHACFSLATIACWLRARQSRWGPWHVVAILCLALGLLSKPAAMVTPAIVLVIEWLARRLDPGSSDNRPWRTVILHLLPSLVLCVAVGTIAKLVQPGTGIESGAWWQRPVVAGASLSFYFSKLVWPANLAFDYGWRPLVMLQKTWFYVIASFPLLLGVVIWIGRRRCPMLLAAALIFVIGLGPVLGLVRFTYQFYSTVGDHYVYLSMLGVALAVSSLLVNVPERLLQPVRGGVFALAAVLAVLSLVQMSHWRDIETCLRRTLAVTPCSSLARNNLGQVYMMRNDIAAGQREFRKAVECNPNSSIAWKNLVQIDMRTGQVDQMIADYYQYRRALVFNLQHSGPPVTAEVFIEVGQAWAQQAQWPLAQRFFEEALKLEPDNPVARDGVSTARKNRLTTTRASTTRAATSPSR